MAEALPHSWWYKRSLRVLAWFAYAAGIFYLSSRNWHTSAWLPEGADKIVHFFLYAFFAICTAWALRLTRLRHHKKLIFFAVIIVALYGASDEFHQSFVSGRSSSFYDWLADLIGAGIGARIAWQLALWKEKKYAAQLRKSPTEFSA